MLLDILLGLLQALLSLIEWILPNWKLPEYVIYNLGWLISQMAKYNDLIPVTTLIWCISFVFLFELGLLIVNALGGIISILRGGGKIDV